MRIEHAEQGLGQLGKFVVELVVNPPGQQRERLDHPFDVWIFTTVRFQQQAGGDLGVPLCEFRSYLAQKCSPVLFYRPLCIFGSETEIQAPLAISLGKSARPGAEAMNQPPQVDKGFGVENLALSFPEGFQRHRNILATYPRSCNAACAAISKRYVNDWLPSPHHRPRPRIIPRCADSEV